MGEHSGEEERRKDRQRTQEKGMGTELWPLVYGAAFIWHVAGDDVKLLSSLEGAAAMPTQRLFWLLVEGSSFMVQEHAGSQDSLPPQEAESGQEVGSSYDSSSSGPDDYFLHGGSTS